MLIGREKEISKLQDLHNSRYSEFVAVYGRRRVGKTFLINTTFAGQFFFTFTGSLNETKSFHLKRFCEALGIKRRVSYWDEAFDALKEKIIQATQIEKKVIFIDEISWIDVNARGFLSNLAYFWNTFCSVRNDVLLIICGSAVSWITDKIFNDYGSLHHRVTARILVQPFTLNETKKYLSSHYINYSDYDILILYMIFGGIPYYLRNLERTMSAIGNVDHLLFNKNATLKNEYEVLFNGLFKDAEKYRQVLELLGNKYSGLSRNEIIEATELSSGGRFAKIMNDLILCSFVDELRNYGNKKKESVYKISDNFTAFYHAFMKEAPNANDYFVSIQNTSKFHEFKGIGYERVSYQHLEQIKSALGIRAVYTVPSFFRNAKTQIDLILDRNDSIINICEIKCINKPYEITKQDDEKMRNRIGEFQSATKTKKSVTSVYITTYGLVSNMYEKHVMAQVVLDDLFKE
jgi:AAA+ ATPase superfamily predicted ATPase